MTTVDEVAARPVPGAGGADPSLVRGDRWLAAPVPDNEVERLEALHRYQVLDTVPEQDYEDLVALAATICQSPMASLTLVDSERQWFKAVVGISVRETCREDSFCAHAILDSEVFQVEDAASDDRFAGNPFVTGDPGIRFYAGAPLITPDGLALGTLCVVDTSPRCLSPEQVQALAALSRQAVSLLELRRQRLVDAERLAGLGSAQEGLRRRSEYLKLLAEVAVAVNRSGDLAAALQPALELVSRCMGWPIAHAVVVSQGRPKEAPVPVWHAEDPAHHALLRSITAHTRVGLGESLPTAVVANGRPVVLREMASEVSFSSRPEECELRIRSAAAFPVISGAEVVAVMEFFAEKPMEVGDDVLEVMDHIGAHLGQTWQRLQAVNELSAYQSWPRGIIDTVDEAFVATDSLGLITDWNSQAQELLGWSPGEAIGRSLIELIVPPALRPGVYQGLERFLEDGRRVIVDHRLLIDGRHRDGRIIPVELAVWSTDSGPDVRFNVLIRHHIEHPLDLKEINEVREANGLFGAVLGATTAYAIIGTNTEGEITFFNVGAERMLGYSSYELVGQETVVVLHDPAEMEARAAEKGTKAGFEALVSAARCGLATAEEWTYLAKDGTRLTVSVTVTAMKKADGALAGFIATAFDISARRRADDARSELATIVESSDDAMMSMRTDGIIRSWNPAAERLYGYRAEEAIGCHASMLRSPEQSQELQEVLDRLERGETVAPIETVRIHKDGRRIPVDLTISPIVNLRGGVVGWSAIARDITKRKRGEAAVLVALTRQREMVERLRALDRAKTEFVSSVSHELRTPLTGILGYVEMLTAGDAGPMGADQLRLVQIVDVCASRLLTLIEDLLTVSRVESGTFTLDLRPFALRQLMAAVREGIHPVIAGRVLELSMEVEERPTALRADKVQLERMLMNLLTNAIKFTPDGGRISLTARSQAEAVVLTVSDTGFGISADDQPRLFERFFRSPRARELAVPGTGLGLGIVKSIVDAHGGSIDIFSVPGEGTQVQVTLPCLTLSHPKDVATIEASGASPGVDLDLEKEQR